MPPLKRPLGDSVGRHLDLPLNSLSFGAVRGRPGGVLPGQTTTLDCLMPPGNSVMSLHRTFKADCQWLTEALFAQCQEPLAPKGDCISRSEAFDWEVVFQNKEQASGGA